MSQSTLVHPHPTASSMPKHFVILLIAVMNAICFGESALASDRNPQIQTMGAPIAFTENHGQWPDDVLFRTNGVGATMWFTKKGLTYQFSRQKAAAPMTTGTPQCPQETPEIEQLLVNSTLVGANPNPIARGEIMMEYTCNYFIGNDSTAWRIGVPNYEAIVLESVYQGIDLKFYGTGEKLEYDFIVAPGADYSRIQIQYDGANSLTVDEHGNLIVETDWGHMTQLIPLVYQLKDGVRQTVAGEFKILSPGRIGFRLSDEYDPTLAVVIDPVLTFSTYLGGSGSDIAYDVAVDGSNQAIVVGRTTSVDFPMQSPYDNTMAVTDIFVTKFNAAGTGLLFSTYIGGSGVDICNAITLGNEIYLTGSTTSINFPLYDAEDATSNGGDDAFVLGLNSSGNVLVFSTYLGGSGSDDGKDIALGYCSFPCSDVAYVWVVGTTFSSNFPTLKASDVTLSGGSDGFMTRYSLNLTTHGKGMTHSTFLGGSLSETALGISVLGASGTNFRAYVAGQTSSSDFPTASAYDNAIAGSLDGFVTSFALSGSGDLYTPFSTFLGGNEMGTSRDYPTSIIAFSSSEICVAGYSGASGLGTPGAYDQTYNGGSSDAYIAKLNPATSSLLSFSYFGGSGDESSGGRPNSVQLATDAYGSLYVSGSTDAGIPLVNAADSSRNGVWETFVAKFNSTGSSLLFSTYLGGTSDETGYGVDVGNDGCIYACGETSSSNFPIVNPYDGALAGAADAFLTKVCVPLYVCGDADGSAIVTISDAVYLINYIFAGGPAPIPLVSGDVDCNGIVTISDAVYLINYIFSGGPAPCAACP